MEYVIQLYSGIAAPKVILECYLAYNLRRVTVAQQYFQQLRKFSNYDEKDGIAVGEVLMLKTKLEHDNTENTSRHEVSTPIETQNMLYTHRI